MKLSKEDLKPVSKNELALLQRNIEYLQSYGIDEVVVNVHHFADQIIDTIKRTDKVIMK